jgi:transposase
MKTNDMTSQRTTEELEQRVSSLEKQNAELAEKIKWYEEQFRLSKQRQFGASSEKTTADQLELPLFNEVEISADPKVEEPTVETVMYQRQKTKGERDLKLEKLPKEMIHYSLPAEQQVCSCCQGALHEMTTEVRRELKVIPAEVKVVEHVQSVYACRRCEREGTETPIVKANMPKSVFPKSLASPSSMAYIMNQKYVEGLPLYRQEQQFARLGVSLSRQTIANWVLHGATTWLQPIYNRMYHRLMVQDLLHADETTLQVLREPGRSATATSYLWLYRSGQGTSPIALFDYQQTRASKHPKAFLSPFKGYLHVDGYAGYNGLPNVKLVGCWAHARRKFDEALKALPEQERTKEVLAKQGLQFCNQLFAIEKEIKPLSFEERYQVRLKKSRPILDAFSVWLRQQTPKVLPKSALGKAIKYCRNQWEKLEAFLEDGRLEIDNNRSERSMKPFVIGRKNWLFANTPKGAKASAVTYSIVETAKENGLNPYQYLMFLFEELPSIDLTDEKAIDRLLPWSDALPEHCYVKTDK